MRFVLKIWEMYEKRSFPVWVITLKIEIEYLHTAMTVTRSIFGKGISQAMMLLENGFSSEINAAAMVKRELISEANQDS
jgi:hypothetical protein